TARLGTAVPAALRKGGYDFDVIDAQTPAESVARRHRAVVVAGSTRLGEADEDRLRELRESGTAIVVVDADLLPEAHHTTAAGLLDTVRGIVAPDAAVDHEAVGVVHRRLDGAELYFLANTGAEP